MKNSKKNSLLKRGSALFLVLATIATTLPNSGLFADEIVSTETTQEVQSEDTSTPVEQQEVQNEEVQGNETKKGKEQGTDESQPVTEEQPEEPVVDPVELRTLYAKVTEGGCVEISTDTKVTLKNDGGKVLKIDENGSQEDISSQVMDNGYYPVMSVEYGSSIYSTVRSDSGFKIETYSQLIDNGSEESVEGFETLSEKFSNEYVMDNDKYLSISFVQDKEEEVVADQKTEEQSEEEIKEIEKVLEEVESNEQEQVDVPKEPENYQKNEDGTWDYSTFPVVEEDPDEGTIVLGPDGIEYPVKYLSPNQEFMGKANISVVPIRAKKAMARASAPTYSQETVTMSKESPDADTTGGGYTYHGLGSDGRRYSCITGLEIFPTGKTAVLENIPGSNCTDTQKLLLAMFLTNPESIANGTLTVASGISYTPDTSGWVSCFGNPPTTGASWFMLQHEVGSRLIYGDMRYNPSGNEDQVTNLINWLSAWINTPVGQNVIAGSTLHIVSFGGIYQTLACASYDSSTKVDFHKTTSTDPNANKAGCQINIYKDRDTAKTANKNARAGKPVSTPFAAWVSDASGNTDTTKSTNLDKLENGKTYYAVEVKGLNGYVLDSDVHGHKMVAGNTWELTIDNVTGDPKGLILRKLSNRGSVVVGGAIYRVRYYADGYDDKGQLGSITKTWYIKTPKDARKNTLSESIIQREFTLNGTKYKSDDKPDKFQAGIYVYHEMSAPAGFKKISGNLVVQMSITDDGTVSWKVLRDKSSNSYLGDLGGVPTIKEEPDEAYIELNEPEEFYGFKLPKIDAQYFDMVAMEEDGNYKYQKYFGKTQGNSRFSKLRFEVYNWSGRGADAASNDDINGDRATLHGKHTVVNKNTGKAYDSGELVCTLKVDMNESSENFGYVVANLNLSEGYYKIVEKTEQEETYKGPGREDGNGIWYISLNDKSTNSDGWYMPYMTDENGEKVANADWYLYKEGVQIDSVADAFMAVNPVIGGDAVAIKMDSQMTNAVDSSGKEFLPNGSTFTDLLFNDNFGMSALDARGQLETLDSTTFRVKVNMDKPVMTAYKPSEGKAWRETSRGGIVYDNWRAQVYCVDCLRERYIKAQNHFKNDYSEDDRYLMNINGLSYDSETGEFSEYSQTPYSDVYNTNPNHSHHRNKYICAVIFANEIFNVSQYTANGDYMDTTGSFPEGDYVLEEINSGDGYSKVIQSTPFSVSANSTTLIGTNNGGKKCLNNPPIPGLVKVRKVFEGYEDCPELAPGDATLENAEISIYYDSNLDGSQGFRVNTQTGKQVHSGEVVYTMYTNRKGIAESARVLPYGNYYMKETGASEGSKVNEDWYQEFSITEDNLEQDFTEDLFEDNWIVNPLIYGDVEIYKLCKELWQGDYSDPKALKESAWGRAWGSAQGDANLKDIKFKITNQSRNPVPKLGTYKPVNVTTPGGEVGNIFTKIVGSGENLKSIATTVDQDMPGGTKGKALVYGTYNIQEVASNGKYLLTDGSVKQFQIREDGVVVSLDKNGNIMQYFNNPVRGGISVIKADDPMSNAWLHEGLYAEGDSTRAGAVFEITNKSASPVIVDGVLYQVNDVVKTITTDKDGFATTANNTLPYGTYMIQEVKAPTGYLIDEVWNAHRRQSQNYIKIRTNGEIIALDDAWTTGNVGRVSTTRNQDTPITGGVQIQKWDKELDKSEATGGRDHGVYQYAADLNGIEFTIRNVSEPTYTGKSGAVYIDTQETSLKKLKKGVGEYAVGEDIMTITTHWNAEKKAYTAETDLHDLPYGTYTIRETKTNKEFNFTDRTEYTFKIREDGKMVTKCTSYKMEDGSIVQGSEAMKLMVFKDYVRRGDFSFKKVQNNTGRAITTAWMVTNVSTGERHIVSTNANGEYQSKAEKNPGSDTYAWAPHSYKTNQADWVLEKVDENPQYSLSDEELESLVEDRTGLYFSKGEHGTVSGPRDEFGALPYGEYILSELRSTKNAGLELISVHFYITSKDTNGVVDLGTLDEDKNVEPKITTRYFDDLTNDNITNPKSNVSGKDRVFASDMQPGETYQVTGKMMDYDEEDEGLKVGGRVVRSESEVFVAPANGYKEVDLKYNYDASSLGDRTAVFYAYLYWVKPNGTKTLVAEHKFVDDPLERNQFPVITTKARDYYTSDEVGTNFNQHLVDKVTYNNLLLDRTYVMEGELREKSTGVVVATGSTTFSPKAEDGNVEVHFELNHTTDGQDYVVYEKCKLSNNGAVVADHMDMEDLNQTIHYPKVKTQAIEQNTMSHVGTVTEQTTQIKDTVSLTNLVVGKEYTVTGKLMNKDTNSVFQYNGKDVTASETFVAKEKNETHVLTFTVKTTDIAGQTLVAFEDLYHKDVRVATHSDLTDEEQSIHYPEIDTNAIDVNTKDEVGKVNKTQIKDTVHLTNLIPGLSYTLSGVAMDKDAHITLGADMGIEPHRAVRTFTATASEMDIEMLYSINASKYEEKTLVIFENLIFNGKVVRVHNDYNDKDQTVHFPKVRTTALEDNTGTHVGTVTDEETTITDTVKCTNLVVGKKYHVHGVLVNKETGEPFRKDNEEVRAGIEFTAESADQSVELVFTVKTADLAGQSLVAFEDLLHNGVVVATHAEIEDEDQTIRYPEIITSASDTQTEDNVAVVGKTSVKDRVELKNLVIGQEYILKGRLMDKDTKEYLGQDKGKDEIKKEYVFTATAHDMAIEMEYPVDASLFEGKTSVVFENLYVGSKLVRNHEDFNDVNQTVHFPKIRTSALDDRTETHVGTAVEGLPDYIVDTVSYTNLVPGKEYTVSGVLVLQDTGEPYMEDGEEVRASKTFTPTEPDGTVDLKFVLFESSNLAERSLVVFEDLYHNSVKVTTHSDIKDESQTIHYPELKTSMLNTQTGDEVGVVGKTQFKDTVHLTNLIPNQEYSILGTLMDKETKEYLGKDKDMPITRSVKTFVATDATMDVEMLYDIDASLLEDKTVVAFEDLIVNGVVVRKHEDIEDINQTNWIPKIRTTMESEFGLKDALADYEQKLVDTVPYWNLVPGKTYTLKGTLMVKETGEPLLINGEPVTAEDTFTPDSSSGERKLTFVIKDASVLENKTTVAFEDLQHNGITVTTHSKIDDYDQSVRFPKVRTFALDVKTDLDEGVAEAGAGVYDTVKYDNLEEGATYTVKGTLMDKATGKALEINGKKIEGETTFKVPGREVIEGNPKSVSGTVKVKFNLDASTLEGKTLVVFERLYREDTMVGHHEDIDDENQDIKYIKLRTNAIDTDTEINDADYTGERTIVDTVKYWNATIGNEYTLKAVLMDKETNKPLLVNGKEITSEKTFIATSVDGEVEVKFTLDASALEGKTIVAFERMYREGKLVAIHAEIKDKDQSIYFPKLRTLAVHNDTVFDEGMYGKDITLVDQVSYENLKPGREYELQATIMDKGTGEPFLVNGNPVVATVKFVAGQNGTPVYGGAALPLEDQATIGLPPAINPDLEEIPDTGDADNADEEVGVPEAPEVKEPVRRDDHGEIFDNTEKLLSAMETLKEGYKINSEDRVSGTINVPITFNTLDLAGKDIVVFEEMFVNGKRVGHHTDIEDEGQTVGFPAVETTALDGENETHEQQQQKEAVIVDTVDYTNLTPGKSYTVNGVLMDKETNEPVLVDGKKVTATTTFVPKEKDGSVELVFKFDSSALAGKDLVAFEEVRREGRLVATHTDIEDDNQTVDIIDIKTLAVDKKTLTHEQQAAKNVSIIDTVSYTNLMVGEEYVLTGYLMNKNTGEQLFIDDKPVEGTTTFVPEERDGEVQVEFLFNSKDLAGIDTVVFEQLWHDGVEVATHTDIEDEGQTVDIIQIKTNATDSKTGTHEQQSHEKVTIYDDVTYTNLVVGKEYVVKGVLMNQETGEPLLVDGKEVTARKTFVPTERNGVVRLAFKFDSSALAGTTVVAFEDLYREGIKIATHSNITDKKQTVEIIDIKTTATDAETGTHEQQVGKKVTIVDWVEYTNLTVGKKYTVKGTLMDKSTGKALKVNGKKVTAKKTFVPNEPNGSVDVEFTFDSSGLEGKRLVVFEDLYRSGVKVATHADIEDKGQTVKLIDIRTNAVSKKTGTHEQQINENTVVVDTVTYKGLTVGKEYVVKGVLMNRATGKALKVDGKKITATKKFTPKKSKGSVELVFKFDSSALAGKQVVAFEDLYRDDIKVATHSDIEDDDQTVSILDIGTVLSDKNSGSHTATLGDEITLVDIVKYKGLTPGKTYKLKGILKDKATEGNIAEATAEFVPTESKGFATVEFVVNTNELNGKTVVAFEKLFDEKDIEISVHEDINDEDQTVVIPVKPATPKTSDMNWMYWLAVLLGGLGIAGLIIAKKREDAEE